MRKQLNQTPTTANQEQYMVLDKTKTAGAINLYRDIARSDENRYVKM